MPQYPGAAGLIAQPGMIPHQQVTMVIGHMTDHMTTIPFSPLPCILQLVAAASPKFLTEVPTQPQVIGMDEKNGTIYFLLIIIFMSVQWNLYLLKLGHPL
jgi:hypothetical protein